MQDQNENNQGNVLSQRTKNNQVNYIRKNTASLHFQGLISKVQFSPKITKSSQTKQRTIFLLNKLFKQQRNYFQIFEKYKQFNKILNEQKNTQKQIEQMFYQYSTMKMNCIEKYNQLSKISLFNSLKSFNQEFSLLQNQLQVLNQSQIQYTKKFQQENIKSKQFMNDVTQSRENLACIEKKLCDVEKIQDTQKNNLDTLNQSISRSTFKLFILSLQSWFNSGKGRWSCIYLVGSDSICFKNREWCKSSYTNGILQIGKQKLRFSMILGLDNIINPLSLLQILHLYPNLIYMMQRISFCTSYIQKLIYPGLSIPCKQSKFLVVFVLIDINEGLRIQGWKSQILQVKNVRVKSQGYKPRWILYEIQIEHEGNALKKNYLFVYPTLQQSIVLLQRRRKNGLQQLIQCLHKGQRKIYMMSKISYLSQQQQIQKYLKLVQLLKK